MIRRLRGTVAVKDTQSVIVDVAGVGYGLAVSVPTGFRLGDLGDEVTLHVHTHVYEGGLDLYGFLEADEREVFLRLIAVSGIGPRLAINILSGMEAADLLAAVAEGAIARLVKIPGVGKKTAERMVVELKDRFADILRRRGAEAGAAGDDASVPSGAAALLDDVRSALTNLGYRNTAVGKVVPALTEAAERGDSIQDLIREALRLLQR